MIQGCRCLRESILGSRNSGRRSREGEPPCPGVPGPDHEPNILRDEGQPRRDNKDRWISLDATTSREEAHPGARASRPHALPLRAAQFPPIRRPATLPAETAWAAPKQSPGAVAGRPGWRRWPRLCQDVCGRDARAPGWVVRTARWRISGWPLLGKPTCRYFGADRRLLAAEWCAWRAVRDRVCFKL